ncbi:hypothetical protein BC940DRAFT_331556 [Gongronella butleri]|nr:hypothetical protein BC940DRAFT_331556 [Gongronella butleri]
MPSESPKAPAESSKASSPPSSAASSPKPVESTDQRPAKKPRQRAPRKPPASNDNSNMGTPSASNDELGTPSRPSSTQVRAMYRIRCIAQHKDIPTRKWEQRPLSFYTIGGGKVEIPVGCWQTDEQMQLNKRSTEPTSHAEVDQLFSQDKDFRPFLCTHANCSKSFATLDLLQTHENNMHGQKKQVCGIDGCLKSFATSGQLTKHRKMVHFRSHRKKKLEEAAAAEAATTNADDDTSTAANTPSVLLGNDDDDLQSMASTHDSPSIQD